MVGFDSLDRRTVLGFLAGSGASMSGLNLLDSQATSTPLITPSNAGGNCREAPAFSEPVWTSANQETDGGETVMGQNQVRTSYTQLVSYKGARWDESDAKWEHDFSVFSIGRHAVQDDLAACESSESSLVEGAGGFQGDNRLRAKLTDTEFGAIEASYQSDDLVFWNRAPFLKEGADPEETECIHQLYKQPELFTQLFEDNWKELAGGLRSSDTAPSINDVDPGTIDQDLSTKEKLTRELVYTTASYLLTKRFGPVIDGAEAVMPFAQILAEEIGILGSNDNGISELGPNEGLDIKRGVNSGSPIVGHFGGFKIATDPRDTHEMASPTSEFEITSTVEHSALDQIVHTTTVPVWTYPTPIRTDTSGSHFSDWMFHRNLATKPNGKTVLDNEAGVPDVTLHRSPATRLTANDSFEVSPSIETHGNTRLDYYAWVWIIYGEGQTPGVGSHCAAVSDASEVEDLQIPAEDLTSEGQVNVYFVAANQTGVTSVVKKIARIGETTSAECEELTPTPTETTTPTSTPTPTPESTANYEVVTVDAPPEVVTGDPIDLSATVENNGDQEATDTVEFLGYYQDSPVDIYSEEVALGPGQQTEVSPPEPPTSAGTGTFEYTVETGADSASGVVDIVEPTPEPTASYEVVTVDAPSSITDAEPIELSATIRNTGDATEPAIFEVESLSGTGRTLLHEEMVELAPGESTTKSLDDPPETPSAGNTFEYVVSGGTHEVQGEIDILQSEQAHFYFKGVDAPDQVDLGTALTVDTSVGFGSSNRSDVSGTVELIDDSDGSVVDSQDVTSTPEATESVSLSRPASANDEHGIFQFVVETRDDSLTGAVDVGAGMDAVFEIVELDYPEHVLNGQIYVDVTLENTGASAGTQTVRMGTKDISDPDQISHLHGSSEVDLGSGERTTITLPGTEWTYGDSYGATYRFVVKTADDVARGTIALGDNTP